jgi:hypothetical protein
LAHSFMHLRQYFPVIGTELYGRIVLDGCGVLV